MHVYVCSSVCNGAQSQRIGALWLWRGFYSVHLARGHFGTHRITDAPHQKNSLFNRRGRRQTGVISGLEIRTNESREWGAGSALVRICEPSRGDTGRSFNRRGPTELKDLSPTVRSLNNGVATLWPSADQRERECIFFLSMSERMMDIDHSGI